MLIIAARTDTEEAELYLYENLNLLEEKSWLAHKELSVTLHSELKDMLGVRSMTFGDIEGIVAYKGPGSFTGLRIGAAVFNTIADSLAVPIVGTNSKNWRKDGISKLLQGEDDRMMIPEYGRDANITKPKK